MTKRQEYMYIYLGLRVPVRINTLASLCNGVDNEYTIQGSFKSFFEGAYYSLLHRPSFVLSRLIVEGSLLESQDILFFFFFFFFL